MIMSSNWSIWVRVTGIEPSMNLMPLYWGGNRICQFMDIIADYLSMAEEKLKGRNLRSCYNDKD